MNKVDPNLVEKVSKSKDRTIKETKTQENKHDIKVDEDYIPAMYLLLF